MDKAVVYSILTTWTDMAESPAKSKWCSDQIKKILLHDQDETILFLKNEKNPTYLDLLSKVLPQLAYEFQSWSFIREMEAIGTYHDTQIWHSNLNAAKEKIKKHDPEDHRQIIVY